MNTTYFMDHEEEAKRLTMKVSPEEFVKKYLSPYIKNNAKILDVGCGSGIITRYIAKWNPSLTVVGLDSNSKRFISENKENHNISFIEANAYRLPFQDNSFDLVYSRFLIEYLEKPEEVVQEIQRVLKKGGKVLLQDLDGQIYNHYPENESIQERIQIILDHLKKTGFDPNVGRKLFFFLKEKGFKHINTKIESYHLYPGKIDERNETLWDMKLTIALGQIKKALGSKENAVLFKKDFLEYLRSSDTLTFSNMFTVIGEK